MSARDTARLLLAGVPTAREVEYHEWTKAKPECRGELRAAGEVLWFTYAGYEPPTELPTEPGAVIHATRMYGVDFDRRILIYAPADETDDAPWLDPTKGTSLSSRWSAASDIDEWEPATVVPAAAYEAAVKALRDVVTLLDGPQSGDAQEAQDTAMKALRVLDGEVP